MKNTIVGVDLAKDVIQVCVYAGGKVQSNTEMKHHDFKEWLFTTTETTVVFEACGTSNYWKQKAVQAGHAAHLISADLVSKIRQNQKTDRNDALAIVQASLLPDISFIKGKTVEQQQLQSILRLRELAVKQKTASGKQLKALLLEFNIRVSARRGGLGGVIESVLEDAENEFSPAFREALYAAWQHHLGILKSISVYDKSLEQLVEQHEDCKRLLQLEGVGVINAVNLYIALGCADLGSFCKGKDASACIGLTPIQHTSGGKVKLGSIGRYVKNSLLRSQLITGAMAVVAQVTKRVAVTRKEEWIQQLVARRGKKIAAVALANKNVRTAFAMLTQGTEYKAEPVAA